MDRREKLIELLVEHRQGKGAPDLKRAILARTGTPSGRLRVVPRQGWPVQAWAPLAIAAGLLLLLGLILVPSLFKPATNLPVAKDAGPRQDGTKGTNRQTPAPKPMPVPDPADLYSAPRLPAPDSTPDARFSTREDESETPGRLPMPEEIRLRPVLPGGTQPRDVIQTPDKQPDPKQPDTQPPVRAAVVLGRCALSAKGARLETRVLSTDPWVELADGAEIKSGQMFRVRKEAEVRLKTGCWLRAYGEFSLTEDNGNPVVTLTREALVLDNAGTPYRLRVLCGDAVVEFADAQAECEPTVGKALKVSLAEGRAEMGDKALAGGNSGTFNARGLGKVRAMRTLPPLLSAALAAHRLYHEDFSNIQPKCVYFGQIDRDNGWVRVVGAGKEYGMYLSEQGEITVEGEEIRLRYRAPNAGTVTLMFADDDNEFYSAEIRGDYREWRTLRIPLSEFMSAKGPIKPGTKLRKFQAKPEGEANATFEMDWLELRRTWN